MKYPNTKLTISRKGDIMNCFLFLCHTISVLKIQNVLRFGKENRNIMNGRSNIESL